MDVIAPGGHWIQYGATAGPAKHINLFKLFWKQVTLRGSTMGSPEEFEAMLDHAIKCNITPTIDKIFPLIDCNQAITRLGKKEQFGKILIDCT